MQTSQNIKDVEYIVSIIDNLLSSFGNSVVSSVAYDTAWVARLANKYENVNFSASLEWLRQHQNEDGTWGAPLLHYHDRFASTLAAIVALKENGTHPKDAHRVQRGEDALWKLISKLGHDDSDTVGFPIVAMSLVVDATELGLDVPTPSIRFARGYQKKVDSLLNQPSRYWLNNPLAFSLEGLYKAVHHTDTVLEANHSVASSPAATAAYLMRYEDQNAIQYLQSIQDEEGGIPALSPINIFEITWSLNHLYFVGVLQSDHPRVRELLDMLWSAWSDTSGLYYSDYFKVPDLDITSASFILLNWAGYPVSADVFEYFELDTHFCTYINETDPSPGSHLRLLTALQHAQDHPKYDVWVEKVLNALMRFDENGSYWSDKWHASPYYVNHLAIYALHNVNNSLIKSRIQWIIRTQITDGGWGYLDTSTPEETAYCLDALLYYDQTTERIDPEIIEKAASYLSKYIDYEEFTPLWISKGLYTPTLIVKSAIVSTLYRFSQWKK